MVRTFLNSGKIGHLSMSGIQSRTEILPILFLPICRHMIQQYMLLKQEQEQQLRIILKDSMKVEKSMLNLKQQVEFR